MKPILIVLLVIIAGALSQRLSRALIPELYELSLKVYLDETDGDRRFSFDGQSTITIRCDMATNRITMHATKLDIENSAIQVKRIPSGQAISVEGVSQDDVREMVTISLSTTLAPSDRISVFVKYRGKHNFEGQGFSRSSYQQDTQTRIIAYTDLQPNFAHQVFPCFDEPSFKANFSLTAQYRQGRRALSNMPIKSERDLESGWKETSFLTSPPMPAYIFSLFISDYTCISRSTSRNVQVSVCAPDASVQKGLVLFALNEAVSHLEYFEKFFDVLLPLPKYDLVGIPNYQLAMENWGLMYFNDPEILVNPATSSLRAQMTASGYIAHEIVHMWVGDFVTFDWWNDIWLKEGIPMWLQYLATSSSQATWNSAEFFIETEYLRASVFDSAPRAGPLNIHNVTIVNLDFFGGISFGKSASVARMLYGALGEDTFRKGLGNLFRARAFGVVTADDVWQMLTEQGRRDGTVPASMTVKDFMDTWIEQPGIPILNVSRQPDNTLAFTQSRFLIDPASDPSTGLVAPYNFKWWIPISWATSSNGRISRQSSVQWMGPSSSPSAMKVGPSPNWYLINLDMFGFYRVLYDYDNWFALAQQLRGDRTRIPTMIRAQLMTDSFALNRANRLNPIPFFLFLSTIQFESEHTVWSAIDGGIFVWVDTLEEHPVFQYLHPFLLCQLRGPMLSIDMASSETQKSFSSRLKRPVIVHRACTLGLPECVTPAVKLWSNWKRLPSANPIPEDIRFDVYCAAVREGRDEDWNFAYNQLTQPGNSPAEARNLRKALTCTRNTALLSNVFNMLKQNTIIQTPDVVETLGFLFDPLASRRVTWNWLKNNLPWAQQQFLMAPVPFMTMIRETLARKMTLDADVTDIKTLAGIVTNTDGADAIYDQAVGRVVANIRWRKDNERDLLNALIDYNNVYKCGTESMNPATTTLILTLLFTLLLW